MGVIATDNFNRANETPLSGGGNWSVGTDNPWNLSSNIAVPSSVSSDDAMHYTAGTWPNDHYSKADLTVSGTGGLQQGVGLTVRGTTAATTYYRAVTDHAASNNVSISKMVNGVYTNLALVTSSWTDGSTWELDAQGTSLTFKRAGSTILTATDASIASGKPGIILSSNVTSASLDNWEGGDFSAGAHVIAIGQVVETDSAQPIARKKLKTINQVVETDTAQSIAKLKQHAMGQVVETDLAQTLARRKQKAIGQATETDTAQSLSRLKQRTIGQVTETDFAQPISPSGQKIVAVNQVTETDLAQAVTHRKLKAINAVTESDLAQPLTRAKLRTLGIPIETDLAQAIARRKAKAVSQNIEGDLAQPITWSPKRRMVGQVIEIDLAQPITVLTGERLTRLIAVNMHVNTLAEADLSMGQLVSLDGEI